MDLQASKRCEWNTTSSDLHRSKRTLSNFDEEILLIKEKFVKADYLLCFFGSVVNQFRNGKECVNKDFLIPPSLIEIKNPFISIETAYFEPNKIKSKHYLVWKNSQIP